MSLHPGFPVVEGRYHLTKVWTILLPGRFNRRLEEGSLVLWRPGMTIWLDIWSNDGQETKADRLAVIETGRSAGATSIRRSERVASFIMPIGSTNRARMTANRCFMDLPSPIAATSRWQCISMRRTIWPRLKQYASA